MIRNQIPNAASDEFIEAWFADAGIDVEIVDRCPDAACERCPRPLDRAA